MGIGSDVCGFYEIQLAIVVTTSEGKVVLKDVMLTGPFIWTSYKMSHARVINLGYLFINFKHIKEKTLVFRCFVCLVTPILCSLPKSSGRYVFHAPHITEDTEDRERGGIVR